MQRGRPGRLTSIFGNLGPFRNFRRLKKLKGAPKVSRLGNCPLQAFQSGGQSPNCKAKIVFLGLKGMLHGGPSHKVSILGNLGTFEDQKKIEGKCVEPPDLEIMPCMYPRVRIKAQIAG